MNILFLFVSVLGVLDSGYLTRAHYSKDPLNCPIFGGCDIVTNSAYSEIFGVPVAALGLLFYLTVFLLSLISFLSDNKKFLMLASILTPFGFLASMIFVSIMVFVIKALCFYCLISATTSTVLFVLGMVFLKREWKKKKPATLSENQTHL